MGDCSRFTSNFAVHRDVVALSRHNGLPGMRASELCGLACSDVEHNPRRADSRPPPAAITCACTGRWLRCLESRIWSHRSRRSHTPTKSALHRLRSEQCLYRSLRAGPARARALPSGPEARRDLADPVRRPDPRGLADPVRRADPLGPVDPVRRPDPLGLVDPLCLPDPLGLADLVRRADPLGLVDPLRRPDPLGLVDPVMWVGRIPRQRAS